MFFVQWLAYRVRREKLKEKIFETESEQFGGKFLEIDETVFKKTPYIKETQGILNNIYQKFEESMTADLWPCFHCLRTYLWRVQKDSFLKLINKLSIERWWEWKRSKPKDEKNNLDLEDFEFLHRVARHIYSLPQKVVSQRELLRRYTKNRESDLVRIRDWLRINYGINCRKRGKSIIYFVL